MRFNARRSRAPTPASQPRRRTHEPGDLGGRYRVGSHFHGARHGDDGRPGLLLRGPRAAEELPQHHDDERRRPGRGERPVGAGGVLDCLRARHAVVGGPVVGCVQRSGPRSGSRVRGHHPAPGPRDVPGDVRDHHAGLDLRRDRGAHAVPRLHRVPAALGDLRVRPARALGGGRRGFRAYIGFLLLWATFVYGPLAHWVWGAGGWLQKLGALDFAGGTVVHISAGVSALVAARMLGPRKDFKRVPIVPHNVPLVLLGAGLLWFGWFGFNAGSALAANGLAALAFTNTNTAAATALLTWVGLDLMRTGKATAVGAATGLVVGLVGITPAAGY